MRLPTETFRILEPYKGVFAYFDGRLNGSRIFSEKPNWIDDGAYALGLASFAVVEGNAAVVYDAHLSVSHGEVIRKHLEGLGVRNFRLVGKAIEYGEVQIFGSGLGIRLLHDSFGDVCRGRRGPAVELAAVSGE